jgi:hypothetical protein
MEFGGVTVSESGPGISTFRSPFSFLPTAAAWECDRLLAAGEALGVSLYPLGDFEHGHAFLAIDPAGRVFLVMECVWLVGNTLDEALVKLIRGIEVEPIPLPGFDC